MNTQNILHKIGTLLFYGVILFMFILPIVRLLLISLQGPTGGGYSLQNFQQMLAEPRTVQAISNTLLIATISTIGATIGGTCLALVMAYVNIKRKQILELLILLPFVIPAYITTLSWSGLFAKWSFVNKIMSSLGLPLINIYSTVGILFIITICNIPIVYLSVIHMLRRIPADLEWATRTCGFGIGATLWRINLRVAWPAIASGSLLAFLSAIDNFSVPAFLGIPAGIPVLSTYIYEKAISFSSLAFAQAATLAVLLSVIALAGTMLEKACVRREYALDEGKVTMDSRIYLSKGKRRFLEWALLLALGAITIVPLLTMVSIAFSKNYGLGLTSANISMANFTFVLSNKGVISAIINSVTLAVMTSFLCIIIGLAIAYSKVRYHNQAMVMAERSAALTYALPGIVLALAMIFHWIEPLPGIRPGVYGTIGILLIAYVTRYLILQIKGSTVALQAISVSLEDAVRSSGRNKFTLWKDVLWPMLRQPIFASSFLIFVASLTELTLSSMLASAGTKTIGLTIFSFQQAGEYNLSAAMSTIIVLLILLGYGSIHFRNGR